MRPNVTAADGQKNPTDSDNKVRRRDRHLRTANIEFLQRLTVGNKNDMKLYGTENYFHHIGVYVSGRVKRRYDDIKSVLFVHVAFN